MFVVFLAAYVAVGALLAFHYESFHGDAQNRVANAFYVLFSRDPHLAAIGFVWNPLPSLAVLPLLPLKFLWPALTERAFAGNIVSALFMAGAVYQLHAVLVDFGVRRVLRAALTVLFALHPMILYYGANGMSEASLLFGLLVVTRYLNRWLVLRSLTALVVSAGGLALAYLSRQEALFAAAGATLVVLAVAWRRDRFCAGAAQAIVYAAPCAAAFVVLAGISWVVVGRPFEQFSSVYGTASQLQVIESLGNDVLAKPPLTFAAGQVWALTPFLPVAAVLALAIAGWRRDPRVLAPLGVIGSVLLFAIVAFALGKTIGSTRYFIAAIPLTVLLAGLAASGRPDSKSEARAVRGQMALFRPVLVGIALAITASGIPASAAALRDPGVDPEDSLHLGYILTPRRALNEATAADKARFGQTRAIAAYLDDLRLPNGAILVDNFTSCVPFVVLGSVRPKQFVITNDRDFEQVLAGPAVFGVRYLLLPPPDGYGKLNALNRSYPGLYETGAGIATLAHEFTGLGCPNFRLYRVKSVSG